MAITLSINGQARQVDVPEDMPLLWVLRDELNMVGTKFGCGAGTSGACTVHMDGAAVRSCQTPVGAVGGAKITTIEGVGASPHRRSGAKGMGGRRCPPMRLLPGGSDHVGQRFAGRDAKPTRAQIGQGMSGNLALRLSPDHGSHRTGGQAGHAG
jgi:isoquinoline 1-oxidoreductase alpha subunit